MSGGTKRPRVIAIEEHYFDPELLAQNNDGWVQRMDPEIKKRLNDLGDLRIKEMDEGGIDVAVLSHGGHGMQALSADVAVPLAKGVNDRLYETVRGHPDRYAAFAVLPTADPKAAADELERCVTKYGFKGAMTHGLQKGEFLDLPKYWPIYERAAALDVPIYLHPSTPHPAVHEAYYKDYAKSHPGIATAALAYTVEGMVQGVRIVLSGVFDKHPNLKIILGHMGEGIPFLIWRIHHTLGHSSAVEFREIFCKHFWVTTSGFFSDPALMCTIMEMGADRVIFSIDWPYIKNDEGTEWLDHAALSAEDKAKIYSGNAEKLLRMGRNA
jgi:predicted TIM-barrel fold metal-dependent hydrolase